ncbi:MAG: hypothetical protein EXQ74_05895 [Thermoleophilia bacterium]|nr:hypothetical protein [Thermoleophilia bacterium]
MDAQGRNHRSVVLITGATRTTDGVRYRVRTLRGVIPKALSPAYCPAAVCTTSVTITNVSAAPVTLTNVQFSVG